MKKTQVNVRIDSDLWKRTRTYAIESNTTAQQLTENALCAYLSTTTDDVPVGFTACWSEDDKGRHCRLPAGHEGHCARF